MTSPTLQEIAALEADRAVRSGRWFSLLRLAPAGWAALELDIYMLQALVSAHLRRTDAVRALREREVGVVLVETVGEAVRVPVGRLRRAISQDFPHLEIGIGWASVGPGQQLTWQDAWRWAGQLLVADAAVPAAA
jgi:hypothetical protein